MNGVGAGIIVLLNATALDEARHAFSVMAEDDCCREDNDAETVEEIDRIVAALSVFPEDGRSWEVILTKADWKVVAEELERRRDTALCNAAFLRSDQSRELVEEWERKEADGYSRTAGQIRCAIKAIEQGIQ